MNHKSFLNFLFLLIFKHKNKHIAIFFISIILVFILSSVIFVKTVLKHDALITLDAQSDFVVQKISSGRGVDTLQDWADDFLDIAGVTNTNARVYGKYWYEPNERYFYIIGVDLYEDQIIKNLKKIVKNIDVKKFLSKNYMIISEGVRRHFDYYEYKDNYNFRPPNRSIKKVYIYDVLPQELNSLGNDVVIMDKSLAKEILGIDKDKCTDIALEVPNPLEYNTVKIKLILKHFDMSIIKKDDLKKAYENMFNYKGGLFLTLYIVCLITFSLILYQRYSMINSTDKKEIAILKAVGWSIKDIIKLKLYESIVVAIFAFMIGFLLAYIFVFGFNAPILIDIFLGSNNIPNHPVLKPLIDSSSFVMLFLFFMIPYISAVLIPIWKIAIIDSRVSLR
jgi:ABC-type lipoprotein release transport system permease subunit